MKDSIWVSLLSAFVRWLLVFVAGALARKGIIDQALIDRFMSEGTASIVACLLALVALAWSFRAKIIEWLQFHFALTSERFTPPSDVRGAVRALSTKEQIGLALKG